MTHNRALINHRRNGVAVFKDYSAPQDSAPIKPLRFTRDRGREALSPLDTNKSPTSASRGYILSAKSLEGRVVEKGTYSSAGLGQKIPSRGKNIEEEEVSRTEALLNEMLTWFGASIIPPLGEPPKLKELRHQLPHGKNPAIIIELLARIDELLDEIQNHELYQGHPDKPIDSGANSYNSPKRRHRYTHPQPHLPIPHVPRQAFSFGTSNPSKCLWALEDVTDESSSDGSPNNSDLDYEEGDGCALSLLELGAPLPPLPSKWSQIVMEVQPLFLRLNL